MATGALWTGSVGKLNVDLTGGPTATFAAVTDGTELTNQVTGVYFTETSPTRLCPGIRGDPGIIEGRKLVLCTRW